MKRRGALQQQSRMRSALSLPVTHRLSTWGSKAAWLCAERRQSRNLQPSAAQCNKPADITAFDPLTLMYRVSVSACRCPIIFNRLPNSPRLSTHYFLSVAVAQWHAVVTGGYAVVFSVVCVPHTRWLRPRWPGHASRWGFIWTRPSEGVTGGGDCGWLLQLQFCCMSLQRRVNTGIGDNWKLSSGENHESDLQNTLQSSIL